MARALPRARRRRCGRSWPGSGWTRTRAETPVSSLSGGEKARLLLALATREAPHLLILDEPTNHLDIDAREALVRALGGLRRRGAADHATTRIWWSWWPTGSGWWRTARCSRSTATWTITGRCWRSGRGRSRPRRGGGGKDDRRERAEARASTAPLRKRAKDAEAKLALLGAERAKLDRLLADPALYVPARKSEVTAAQTKLAAITKETEAAETEWLEAAEALEAV